MTTLEPDTPRPPAVPIDPELAEAFERITSRMEPLDADNWAERRVAAYGWDEDIADTIAGRPISFEDVTIPGPPGAPDVTLAILRPTGALRTPACIYHIHGGGMYLGTRFTSLADFANHVEDYGVTVVSVEYRLAPDNPHPAPVEDSYAGFVWTAGHHAELGFEPGRIVVVGGSAGGGLSAAVALLARDRGGPAMAGQGLYCPMVDDRNDTLSARQFDGVSVWNRQYNHWGWRYLLGDAAGSADVSPYAAPARAASLENLPPAFIDVGAAEVFRSEDVEYASRLWAAGGQAELHVWGGAFHGFTPEVPESLICEAARRVRASWLERILNLPAPAVRPS